LARLASPWFFGTPPLDARETGLKLLASPIRMRFSNQLNQPITLRRIDEISCARNNSRRIDDAATAI
jgi:hypothetical protein